MHGLHHWETTQNEPHPFTLSHRRCVCSLRGAHANALEELAKHDPALAEAIKDAKAHGDYGGAYQSSQRDIERANAYLARQDELYLRLMGMTPDIARKGIGGSAHKQDSMCTFYIRRLLGDYDGGFRETYDSDQDVIIRIERSGMCERRNLSIRP